METTVSFALHLSEYMCTACQYNSFNFLQRRLSGYFIKVFLRSSLYQSQCTYYHWNCHYFSTYFSGSLYLESLQNSFSEIFLSVGTVTSNMVDVRSLKSLIVVSGQFACIFLSVWTGKCHSTITFFPFATSSDVCSYHFSELGIS